VGIDQDPSPDSILLCSGNRDLDLIFLQTPVFKDFGQLGPVISALGTLAIDFCFMASSFPVDEKIKAD
jgi:hypothetical protein